MRRATMLLAALLTGAVLAVSGPGATPAFAAGNAVVSDCYSHGKLTKTYTKAELRHALAVMSSYVQQYSDCQSVVQNALASGKVTVNGGGGSNNGGDGGGGSSSSTAVIIVIVVVVLAIAAFVGLLIRRRRRLSAAGSAADAPTRVIDRDRPPAGDDDDGGDGGPAP
jgi:hypothetical protein